MIKKWIFLAGGLLVFGVVFVSGRSAQDIIRTFDVRPKFPDRGVVLKRSFAIDATRIQMLGRDPGSGIGNKIDFDSRNRLYILDTWNGEISVFGDDGRFVRSFGGKGQGPTEFSGPNMMFIKDDRIHVVHSFGYEIKIVSLDGEYLSSQHVSFENPLRYFANGAEIYLFSGKIDSTFTHLDFILRRFDAGRWDHEIILLTSPYSPGLGNSILAYVFPTVGASGNFIFPEDAVRKYTLIEYERRGKPLQIFGRTYDILPYSDKARVQLNEVYRQSIKNGNIKIPASPPIIRNVFRDQKNNVWVVAGETFEDTDDLEFENTIDIFSSQGAWLYSFKTKSVSKNSVYHGGRIFTLRPADPATFEQLIEVFDIMY